MNAKPTEHPPAAQQTWAIEAWRGFAALMVVWVHWGPTLGWPMGIMHFNDAYNVGLTTKEIVNIYSTKPQFEAIYPRFLSNEQFADKLIENVVGASATDAAKTQAKADVVAAINAGWSKGDVVFQIFTNLSNKPAGDADWGKTAAMLDNKVKVAEYYTETLLVNSTDLGALGSPLQGVTDVASTVDAAKNNSSLNNGQTFTLTANIDNIQGTAGNDTIIGGSGAAGSASTLGSADVINGGAGIDTLKVTTEGAGAVSVTPNLTAVEKVFVQALNTGAATTLNLVNATGVQEIWNERSTQALTVTNVQELAAVGVKGDIGANAYLVGFKDSLAAGVADSVTVALDGAVTTGGLGFGGMTAGEFETINIAATGTNSINALQNATGGALAATKTVNVTGAGKVTVTNALAGTVTTVDASANTGGVSFDLSATGAVKATGGAGNDTFKLGASLTTADVLDGGEGTDIIGVTEGNTLATGLQVTGFETLDVGGAGGSANAFDVSKLSGITTLKVGSATVATNAVTVNNLAKGAGVEINAALGNALNINVKDAGAGSPNDSIAVLVKGATAITTTSQLALKDIETVTLTADKSTATGNVTHIVSDLTADQALTVKVANGNAGLTITDLNAKALVLFDATEATQAVSVSVGVAGASDAYSATNGVAFKLGAGADTLVLTGASTAGGDFFITGGAGGDKITLSTAAAEVDRVVYTSASDSVAGLTATLASKYDVINTFEGTGTDKIDLKALNIAAGQQSFFTKGTTAAVTTITNTGEVAAADKLNFFVNAGAKNGVVVAAAADVDANTVAAQAGVFVYVDANGDGNFDATQDLTIALVGVTIGGANDLVAGSFVFA